MIKSFGGWPLGMETLDKFITKGVETTNQVQYVWDLLKGPNCFQTGTAWDQQLQCCDQSFVSWRYPRAGELFVSFWVGDIRSDWNDVLHRNIYIWFVCCLFATSFKTKACYIPRKFTITVLIFHIVYVAWVAWKLCDGKVRTYLGCNVCLNVLVVWVLSPYFRY